MDDTQPELGVVTLFVIFIAHLAEAVNATFTPTGQTAAKFCEKITFVEPGLAVNAYPYVAVGIVLLLARLPCTILPLAESRAMAIAPEYI